MTLQRSGSLSTDDVRAQLWHPSGGSVSTSGDSERRLARKTSGVTFPDDFYGKGWGFQMQQLSSESNVGDSSNMRPYLMDRRVDNRKFPGTNNHYITTSRSWFGGCYMHNQQNNSVTTPGELAWNGYFRVRNQWPNGIQANAQFELGTYTAPDTREPKPDRVLRRIPVRLKGDPRVQSLQQRPKRRYRLLWTVQLSIPTRRG